MATRLNRFLDLFSKMKPNEKNIRDYIMALSISHFLSGDCVPYNPVQFERLQRFNAVAGFDRGMKSYILDHFKT